MGTKGRKYTPEEKAVIKARRYSALKAKYGFNTDQEVDQLYAKWANMSSRNKGKKGGFANRDLARRAQKAGVLKKRGINENNNTGISS